MLCKKRKLNSERTEWLVLSKVNYLHVSKEHIQASILAKSIGVIFDQYMSLEQHVGGICKVCLFHLRNISKVVYYMQALVQ